MIQKVNNNRGFTLIELLVVAAIVGILLALAIPNLLKARISANEANARKMMQTLRDAEGEFFEQDIDGNGFRDFTAQIDAAGGSLRQPGPDFIEEDALIDSTFTGALVTDGASADGTGDASSCVANKAGYCLTGDFTNATCGAGGTNADLCDDFGWEASMTSYNKTGRRDFAIYGDGVIRCNIAGNTTETIPDPDDPGMTIDVPVVTTGEAGEFVAERSSPGCD